MPAQSVASLPRWKSVLYMVFAWASVSQRKTTQVMLTRKKVIEVQNMRAGKVASSDSAFSPRTERMPAFAARKKACMAAHTRKVTEEPCQRATKRTQDNVASTSLSGDGKGPARGRKTQSLTQEESVMCQRRQKSIKPVAL